MVKASTSCKAMLRLAYIMTDENSPEINIKNMVGYTKEVLGSDKDDYGLGWLFSRPFDMNLNLVFLKERGLIEYNQVRENPEKDTLKVTELGKGFAEVIEFPSKLEEKLKENLP